MLQILVRGKVKERELTKPFPDVLRTAGQGATVWEGGRPDYLVQASRDTRSFPLGLSGHHTHALTEQGSRKN